MTRTSIIDKHTFAQLGLIFINDRWMYQLSKIGTSEAISPGANLPEFIFDNINNPIPEASESSEGESDEEAAHDIPPTSEPLIEPPPTSEPQIEPPPVTTGRPGPSSRPPRRRPPSAWEGQMMNLMMNVSRRIDDLSARVDFLMTPEQRAAFELHQAQQAAEESSSAEGLQRRTKARHDQP